MRFTLNFFFALIFAPTSVCFAKQDLVTQKGFDFLALHLEKSTFKDLKRIFGEMQLKHEVATSQTLTTACYESKDGAVLQLGSSVVGGGRFITQLTLSLAAARGRSSIAIVRESFLQSQNLAISFAWDLQSLRLFASSDPQGPRARACLATVLLKPGPKEY